VTAVATKARFTWQFGVETSCIGYQPSATAEASPILEMRPMRSVSPIDIVSASVRNGPRRFSTR